MKHKAAGEQSGRADPHGQMLRALFSKYDPIFNFFFSKPVTDIVEGILSSEEMALKQLTLWDNDHEFLKRYYRLDEVSQRLQLLAEIHHPDRLWTNQIPTLTSFTGRKQALKRIKRQKKLQRKLQQIDDEEHRSFDTEFLNHTNESRGGPGEQEDSATSYDSSVYDIYQDHEDISLKEVTIAIANGSLLVREESDEWGEVDGPTHLTMDFDDIDRQNILKDYNRMKFKDGLKDPEHGQQSTSINQNTPLNPINPYKVVQAPSKYFQTRKQQSRSRNRLLKVTSQQNLLRRHQRQQSHTPDPLNLKHYYRQDNDNVEYEKKNKLKLKLMTTRDDNENNPGYLSPRLNELSKYSKRIMLTKRPEQNSIEDQDYMSRDSDGKKERVWSPGARYQKEQTQHEKGFGFSSLMMHQTNKPLAHQNERAERYRTLYQDQVTTQLNIIPQLHSNIRMQPQTPMSRDWLDPPSSRQPRDFQRIRKKAIELIREQRNYPSPGDIHQQKRKYQK